MEVKTRMRAIQLIPGIVIALVIAGIVTAAGLKAMGSFKSSLTSDSDEFNASRDTIKGVGEISGQFPTIGIIAAMVVILMLIGGLATYFALR